MVDEEELNHASTALLLTENERQYCFEDRQSVYILEKVGSSKILPLWGLAFYRFLSFAYLLSVPFIWEWVDFPSADVPHFLLFLTQWGIMFAVIYFGAAFSGCGIAYYGFAKQRRNSIHYFSSLAPSLGLFLQLLERLQALALVLEFSITILFWAVLYPQIDHSWCGIRCFSAHGIGTFLLLIDFGLNHLSLEAHHYFLYRISAGLPVHRPRKGCVKHPPPLPFPLTHVPPPPPAAAGPPPALAPGGGGGLAGRSSRVGAGAWRAPLLPGGAGDAGLGVRGPGGGRGAAAGGGSPRFSKGILFPFTQSKSVAS
ncbi:unnamed protein product [Heterosigma akashiwo]